MRFLFMRFWSRSETHEYIKDSTLQKLIVCYRVEKSW